MDRRRVWWVNQGELLEAEKEAGIIWTPINPSGRNDDPEGESLDQIAIGDVILHYAQGKITYISRALSTLEEFRPKADLAELGRGIRVEYFPLQPAIPIDHLIRLVKPFQLSLAPIDFLNTEKQSYLHPFPLEALRLLYLTQKMENGWPSFVQEIFSDRSYWIFQCNPKKFAFQQAVHAGLRRFTWRVTAYRRRIRSGDKVIIWLTGKEGGCVALGTVCSEVGIQKSREEEKPYYMEAPSQERQGCMIQLDYIFYDQPISKSMVRQHPILSQLQVGYRGTNFTATQEQYEAIVHLLLARIKEKAPLPSHQPTYSLTQLAEETYLSEMELASWMKQIMRKKQAIFYGPPGVGKTYIAKKLAQYFTQSGQGFTEIVQFHPSYSYEDFVQGIRPQIGKTGELVYTMAPGIFQRFCQRARQIADPCVLIIDEINRADLARVFGELLYALEYREQKIQLSSGEAFSIPSNVLLFGTMNTADRSIALVDYAMRRRFSLIRIMPNYDILRSYQQSLGEKIEPLIATLQKINRQIGDPQLELGISYFLVPSLAEQLEGIWQMEVEPYLEECFFNQPELIAAFRWEQIKKQVEL